MNKEKNETLKLIIGTLVSIAGMFFFAATEAKVVSWYLLVLSLLLFAVSFFVVSYRGRCLGTGKIAEEPNLDDNVSYLINQIITRGDERNVLVLSGDQNYKIDVVIEPYNGFENFEILEGKYLVPKKLKAKVVDGRLLMPVR